MNKKVSAAAVAALVIGGAVAIIMLLPDDNRGWYAWDPTVGEIDYSRVSATPKIVDVIEQMYGIAYHEKVPKPIKGAKMDFVSLAEPADGGVYIKSSGSGKGVPDTRIFFTNEMTKNMKIVSYGSGFTDTYVQMLGDSVWDVVVAAGNSTWNAYPNNGMLWKQTLAAEMTLNVVNLLSFLRSDAYDAGSTYCLVIWGYMLNYAAVKDALAGAGYSNVEILCIDYYKTIGSLENLLSFIDVLGWLIGVSTADNSAVTDFQERMCAIDAALSSKKDGMIRGGMTVYMERSDGTSPGTNTLMQLCFDLLRLENINKTSGTSVFGDVHVVAAAPDVILFDIKDQRTIYQKMRIIM